MARHGRPADRDPGSHTAGGRAAEDPPDALGSRAWKEIVGRQLVQVMLVKLPPNEPAEVRLWRSPEALRAAKERHKAVPVAAMRGTDELLMPALVIRASRAAALLTGLK